MKLATIAILAAQHAFAQRAEPKLYNGYIEYFFADLGPSYPCHPLYEDSRTWFGADTTNGVRNLLLGLAEAGFNGIRLPMWPDSTYARGINPNDENSVYTRDDCDALSYNIAKVLRDQTEEPFGSG